MAASDGRAPALEATGETFDYVSELASGADYWRNYITIEELTALITAQHEQDDVRPSMVVLGTVSAVEPGSGFSWTGNERRILPFDAPGSMTNTAHLTVDVVETLAPIAEVRSMQLTVGLNIGTGLSIEQVRADYLSLDQVVFYLWKTPVFDYEPGLWGIYEDGPIMGVVDQAGQVKFPLVNTGEGLAPAEGVSLQQLHMAGDSG